jgi:CRISPR/Cas system-associated protein endoribonuclease Cas2
MNKHILRAFSVGMIFTVSASAAYDFHFAKKEPQKITVSAAKQILNNEGYVVLKKAEYKKIIKKPAIQKTEETNINSDTPNKDEINYQLSIEKGMSSSQISALLAAAKIIDDNKAFAEYLISNNYQTKIQLGTYNLTNKMGYEQIAKMITKSK